MPCDINAIYTSLKSVFRVGCGENAATIPSLTYGSIFIRLADIASETREMSRNSKKI